MMVKGPMRTALRAGPFPVAWAAVALAALAAGACATTASQARVTSAFTEQDAQVFDDGIDFVADPGGIGGQWEEDWQQNLERRVGAADFIGTLTVQTIRTDVDLDRRETIRLVTQVHDHIVGDVPSDDLELVVREGEGAYATVEGNERRILNQPFVVFLKWYRAQDGEVKAHWHLAPATDTVVQQTRDRAEKRRKLNTKEPQKRVIIHEN